MCVFFMVQSRKGRYTGDRRPDYQGRAVSGRKRLGFRILNSMVFLDASRLIFRCHGGRKKTMKHGTHIGTKVGQGLMTVGRRVDYTSKQQPTICLPPSQSLSSKQFTHS